MNTSEELLRYFESQLAGTGLVFIMEPPSRSLVGIECLKVSATKPGWGGVGSRAVDGVTLERAFENAFQAIGMDLVDKHTVMNAGGAVTIPSEVLNRALGLLNSSSAIQPSSIVELRRRFNGALLNGTRVITTNQWAVT